MSQQQKIIDTVKNSPTAAKKYYIILWQHIEGSGRAYFQVAFKKDSRKEEFVALSSEKIIRMDSKCQVLQSWWLQTLKEWKINWFADPKRVELMLNKNQKAEEQIEFFIPLTKEGDKEPDRRQKKDLQKLQGMLNPKFSRRSSLYLKNGHFSHLTLLSHFGLMY